MKGGHGRLGWLEFLRRVAPLDASLTTNARIPIRIQQGILPLLLVKDFKGSELVFPAALGVDGAVVVIAGEEGFAVDPGAFDENCVGEFGNAAFVSVEHGDEEIGRSGTDLGAILVDAGEAAGGVWEVEMNEAGVLRDADFRAGEPIQDFFVVADDDLGFIFGEPFGEVFFGPVAVRDDVHGNAVGGDDALLVDEEGAGVVVFDAFIDAGAESKADLVVTEFAEAAEGGADGAELVINGTVETRPGEGITERDRGEVWPFEAHVTEGDRQWRDEKPVDVAAVKNGTEAACGHVRFAQPEFLELVAVTHAGLGGAVEEIMVDAEIAPAVAAGEVGDESDGESVADDAGGAPITHESGDEGIGTVIELLGGFLDFIAGGVSDVGLVAESAGGGHNADAGFLGDFFEGDLSLRHDVLGGCYE